MIGRAKEIIDDQNLITALQLEINQQQKDLNARLSMRRKKKVKEVEQMLDQAEKLAEDQEKLNDKYLEIEAEQKDIL